MSGGRAADLRLRGPSQPTVHVGVFKPRLMRFVGQPCPYCRTPMTTNGNRHVTRDHIFPRLRMSKVAKPIRIRLQHANCICVCRLCNEDKGSDTLHEFMLGASPEQAVVLREFIEELRGKHSAGDFLALTGAPR